MANPEGSMKDVYAEHTIKTPVEPIEEGEKEPSNPTAPIPIVPKRAPVVDDSEIKQIDFTDVMRHKTNYLDVAEVNKMLDYCYQKQKVRDYVFIMTLYRTGRRVSEIVGERPYTRKVGLRPVDILPDGLIEFDILKKNPIKSKTKTGHVRSLDRVHEARVKKMPKRLVMPVDPDYLAVLKNYIEYAGIPPKNRVFPITRQRALQIVHEIAEACGITRPHGKIHNHSFRHSFTIQLLKSNPHDPSILIKAQRLLAHSSLQITQAYAQFTPQDILDTLEDTFNK
jgi:integrase